MNSLFDPLMGHAYIYACSIFQSFSIKGLLEYCYLKNSTEDFIQFNPYIFILVPIGLQVSN